MKKVLFLLILFICSFMITNKQVHALDTITIRQPYAEPQYDDTGGYITVFMKHKETGVYWGRTYVWNFVESSNNLGLCASPYVSATISENKIILDFKEFHNYSLLGTVFLGDSTNNLVANGSTYFSAEYEGDYRVTFSNTNYIIVGYEAHGNIVVDYQNSWKTPVVNAWGNEANEFIAYTEILDYLYNIFLDNESYYSSALELLDKIVDSNDDINDKLTNLVNLIDVYIKSIDSELNEIDINLENIIEILENWQNAQLGESTEPLPNSGITSNKNKENALINKGSVGSITSDVGIELDTTANSSIWSIANSFITCHTLVFGLFISLLSLGVVKLILNR